MILAMGGGGKYLTPEVGLHISGATVRPETPGDPQGAGMYQDPPPDCEKIAT